MRIIPLHNPTTYHPTTITARNRVLKRGNVFSSVSLCPKVWVILGKWHGILSLHKISSCFFFFQKKTLNLVKICKLWLLDSTYSLLSPMNKKLSEFFLLHNHYVSCPSQVILTCNLLFILQKK